MRKSQIEKLEDEIRNQRWQGRLVTTRLEDVSGGSQSRRTAHHTQSLDSLSYTSSSYQREYTWVRRPTQAWKVRWGADYAGRPQRAWLISCHDVVRWPRASISLHTTQHWRYCFTSCCTMDEIPPWYSPDKPKPVYDSENVKAYWDVPIYTDQQEGRCNSVDARIVTHTVSARELWLWKWVAHELTIEKERMRRRPLSMDPFAGNTGSSSQATRRRNIIS